MAGSVSGQADLTDGRLLERLLGAFQTLPRIVDRALIEAETDATPRMARFAAAVDDARDELRSAERAAEDADEDDASMWEDHVEEARVRLARLEAAADDLRSALGDYRSAARELRGLDRETLAAGRDFLSGRLKALKEYDGLRLASEAGTAGNLNSSVDGAPPSSAPDLPQLPAGFSWVPIDRIISRDEPEALQWTKIELSVMEAGMRAFSTDLIPLLRKGKASRNDLAEFDSEHGRDGHGPVKADSLANLHDVFFGSDSIAATLTADGFYDLSSGRHRAQVARQLGWTHIPARLLGQGR